MRKSKFIAILAAAGVFISFALGSGSSTTTTTPDKEISSVETGSTEDPGKELSSADSSNVDESSAITVEEMVLVDQDGIKITATGMDDGLFGTELKLLIENNSEKSFTVQTRDSSVNGFMVETMMSADVAPGKKSNDKITFMTSEIKDCGIKTFATMEFKFHIFDTETWDTVLDTEAITVKTSAADSHVQEYDDSGDVIYEADGIKIVAKGVSTRDSIFGPGLILYIENNSNKDFTVQARDTSVNGFMIDTVMSQDVLVGKKAIDGLTFLSSSLDENGIDEIKEMEFSLHIFSMDNWDTIVDTDPIKLSF